MAINLEVLELLEDTDPTTRQPRIRARVRELKPRTHLVNLKSCNAEQIMTLQNNVGAVLSLPAQETMMNGSSILYISSTDEEFFVIRPAPTIPVSKVVELESSSSTFIKSGDKMPQVSKAAG